MGWLTGRTALVTGASRGIGKAITMLLAEVSADIAFTYGSASPVSDYITGQVLPGIYD
jgi:NAD(P)-dependent dehydrogenase (short-subunit alcohol dehydrogenase family)